MKGRGVHGSIGSRKGDPGMESILYSEIYSLGI
jgi:hypothetical protein